jgi:glycine hydroxymethyltransferase
LPLPPVVGGFSAIRLGTEEITRWGVEPAHMGQLAELVARVLVRGEEPERIRPEVVAFWRRFQELRFVRA